MASQRSKTKILECAREMFYHVGYETTSVDDILQRSGVAKSNFYYHFKSKEQLAFEVLEIQAREFETILVESLRNETLEPKQRFELFCNQVCYVQKDLHRMGGCPFGNFAAALASDGDERAQRFRERLNATFQQIEIAVRECLQAGAARGQFRSDVGCADLAEFVLAALEGAMLLTKTHRDTTPLLRSLAVLQRLLQPF